MKCSDLLKQVNKRSFSVPSQRYSQVLSRHWCFHYISDASVIFWNLTGPDMVKKVRNMLWFASACEGRLWFVPQGLQCQSYLPAQLLLSSFLTCLSPDKTSYQKFPVSMVSACQIDFLCPRCTCACQPVLVAPATGRVARCWKTSLPIAKGSSSPRVQPGKPQTPASLSERCYSAVTEGAWMFQP